MKCAKISSKYIFLVPQSPFSSLYISLNLGEENDVCITIFTVLQFSKLEKTKSTSSFLLLCVLTVYANNFSKRPECYQRMPIAAKTIICISRLTKNFTFHTIYIHPCAILYRKSTHIPLIHFATINTKCLYFLLQPSTLPPNRAKPLTCCSAVLRFFRVLHTPVYLLEVVPWQI